MVERDRFGTSDGEIGELRVAIGKAVKAILMTALATLVVEHSQVVPTTLMFDMTSGAGQICLSKLLLG